MTKTRIRVRMACSLLALCLTAGAGSLLEPALGANAKTNKGTNDEPWVMHCERASSPLPDISICVSYYRYGNTRVVAEVLNNTGSQKFIDVVFGVMNGPTWRHQARNTGANGGHWSLTKYPPLVPAKVCADARYPSDFSVPTVEACIKI
jgi:hypothetical protein